MDADAALHHLFQRKMKALDGDNPSTLEDLKDFYTRNELKLIELCKKHRKDKAFQSLRDFVAFEFNVRRPGPTPPKMTMVSAGESVETHGNPDGIIHRVESSEETAEVLAEAHHL